MGTQFNAQGGTPGFWRSSQNHSGAPILEPRDDALKSRYYRSGLVLARKHIQDWVDTGNVHLLRGEVMVICEYLMTHRLLGLQVYTMILLGIRLFLRSAKMLVQKFKDFDRTLQILRKDCIGMLGVQVKGKSDTRKVSLTILSDNKPIEFCPIRHLMVYMAYSGVCIYSQCLIECNPKPKIVVQRLLSRLKFRILDITGKRIKEEQDNICTHTLRKTG
jgi:hypothetical protein